jgi:thioredoxin 1
MNHHKTTRKHVRSLMLAGFAILMAASVRPAGRDIYPDPSQAKADIAAALKSAAATHRRVILDFGGDWCPDCQVLDIYFHDARNEPLLDANYVLVPINIGVEDANLDIARQYGIDIKKGVPALAVLSEHGSLIYSQKEHQFSAMRTMQSSSVTDFLVHWRPARAGCSAVVINC